LEDRLAVEVPEEEEFQVDAGGEVEVEDITGITLGETTAQIMAVSTTRTSATYILLKRPAP
jgi:hypothetical protein